MAGASLLILGRVATLGGTRGFGWVEGLAVAGGRVVAAGSREAIEATAGRRATRIELGPDEVALPALTDAHLHLIDAALATGRVDLADAGTCQQALDRIAAAHATLADASAWLEGQGWDPGRWGGWPDSTDLERVAPGRRAALWSHDHHALWVSPAALEAAGVDARTPDPAGGVIRRDLDGRPSGVLHENAARLVVDGMPQPTVPYVARAVERLGRRLVAAGLAAVHDPGSMAPDPDLALGFAVYRDLAQAARLPLRVHASLRAESMDRAVRLGLRSGDPLGDPAGGARVGWLKLFADGTLGSRTAAMLDPFEDEPDRPRPPAGAHGLLITPFATLASLARQAADCGLATQIHAIGDAAVRAALGALTPVARSTPLRPRIEHAQLVDPADLPRFSVARIAASVQPRHLGSDAATARSGWGDRAERAYPFRSLAASGALVAFGTDAPVEPWDPWPGIELAVTRREPGSDRGPLGRTEAMDLPSALRAACLAPAELGGERDRGRLVPGFRADLIVVPAASLAEPVEAGGPLGRTRPRLVLLGGRVAADG